MSYWDNASMEKHLDVTITKQKGLVCTHWWRHTSYGHGRRETECVLCGAVLRNGEWVRVNRWAGAIERAEAK